MDEESNKISGVIQNNNTNMTNTKTFTIELLIYNYIFDRNDDNSEKEEKETIDKEIIVLDIPINYNNDNNNSTNEFTIKVKDLKQLLQKKGYPITTSKFYIYLDDEIIGDYVSFNNNDKENDILNSSWLSKNDTNDIIKIKLENYLDNRLIDDTFSILKKYFSQLAPKKNEEKKEIKSVSNPPPEKIIEFNKRSRKIGDVVKIVYAQRKYFNGFYNFLDEKVKLNLEEASNKVGIKRKTLDDYLKQIRKGREKGFDFNKYKDKPISVLREFNGDNNNNNNNNNIDNDDDNDDINDIKSKSNILELDEDI